MKLWAYGSGVCCDEPNGLEKPNELPFCCDCDIPWLFVGLEGICGRLNGGGDDIEKPLGREKLDEVGRGRTGDE